MLRAQSHAEDPQDLILGSACAFAPESPEPRRAAGPKELQSMRDHGACRISLMFALVLVAVMAAGRAAAAPLAEGLAGMPVASQGPVSGALGRADAGYHALPS